MPKIVIPTDEEDRVLTAAAQSDPDNPEWTDDDFARSQFRRPEEMIAEAHLRSALEKISKAKTLDAARALAREALAG